MNDLLRVANDAIFTLQLNTADAITYVIKHTGASHKDAAAAIKQTVSWHKK